VLSTLYANIYIFRERERRMRERERSFIDNREEREVIRNSTALLKRVMVSASSQPLLCTAFVSVSPPCPLPSRCLRPCPPPLCRSLSLRELGVSQVVALEIGDNNRMVLPSDSQLEALGRSDLVAQIKRYGGRQDVARRLGMDFDTSASVS
jgi:hypothetical protein